MNKKIDRRKKYMVVIDTETCPVDKVLAENEINPYNMWVYDIGYAIVDKKGKVYEQNSFIVGDIFCGEKNLMKSAYYAEKIPQYWEDYSNGLRHMTSFYNIRKILMRDIEKYNVTEIYAHNMRFDYGALNNTQRWLTKSEYRYYFPKDLIICDTLKMARDVITKKKSYIDFCKENNFMTTHKTPRPKASAEVLYRFIAQDIDFVESHTALEDVMIEKEILAYCYRQKKKMRRKLWED